MNHVDTIEDLIDLFDPLPEKRALLKSILEAAYERGKKEGDKLTREAIIRLLDY